MKPQPDPRTFIEAERALREDYIEGHIEIDEFERGLERVLRGDRLEALLAWGRNTTRRLRDFSYAA